MLPTNGYADIMGIGQLGHNLGVEFETVNRFQIFYLQSMDL